jgi:hypothetical protein
MSIGRRRLNPEELREAHSRGGRTTAANMTAEQRVERARKASQASLLVPRRHPRPKPMTRVVSELTIRVEALERVVRLPLAEGIK